MQPRNELDDRLRDARVLAEIGLIQQAELEVATILEQAPEDLAALGLLAKIKHVRGELSQAIACWALIHARSPHNDNVMTQLTALLHLAQDPERNAGYFLVLGQNQLIRKPAAQLELEKAFELFHDRRPAEARTQCAALANQYRSRDVPLYKVAVIAGAWIAELSGELDVARTLLEQLGHERGFEHDLDRLFALVRVYERIGTPERLAKAVAICRHVVHELERKKIEKISLHSQLASLERRLGHNERADEHHAVFLAGVRRRMHRPSLGDVVSVAARRHLPLVRLRAIRATGGLPPRHAIRERALGHAIAGERDAASSLLADGGERLDRWYLADLAALDGNDDRATALYLGVVDDAGDAADELGWLLDRNERSPSIAIAEYFADVGRRQRAIAMFDAIRTVTPFRADVWRWLAILLAIADKPDEAQRCRERAAALANATTERERPIGRVLAASVYHFIGKAKGLIHEVWVHREPTTPGRGGALPADAILGNVTPEMRAAVRNTFFAVREYARAKFPHVTADLYDYNYSYKLPKEDEPSGGVSAGLPSALAFLSVFLQQPVPQHVASSGCLVTEAHDVITIGKIGEADFKVKAAYNRNLSLLIMPLANRAELERSALVPVEITREVVQYVADLDQAVKLLFGTDAFIRR